MDNILKGDISITDNVRFIRDIITSSPLNVKVISLEEIMSLPEESPNVIYGGQLTPPIEALMAAADGDEALFNQIYYAEFDKPELVELISVMITYLYRGGSFLLYYPDDDLNLKQKILDIFWLRYGIGVGEVPSRPARYDISCTPIWLGMMYNLGTIDAREFLSLYPDAPILDNLMQKIILELHPAFCNSYDECVARILEYKKALNKNPNMIMPFMAI